MPPDITGVAWFGRSSPTMDVVFALSRLLTVSLEESRATVCPNLSAAYVTVTVNGDDAPVEDPISVTPSAPYTLMPSGDALVYWAVCVYVPLESVTVLDPATCTGGSYCPIGINGSDATLCSPVSFASVITAIVTLCPST